MFCAKINADCPHRVLMDSISNEFEGGWSFDEYEKWQEGTEISEELKDYFREKTELLKKHKKRPL